MTVIAGPPATGESARFDFEAGNTDPRIFPTDALARAASAAIARHGAQMARYPDRRGYLPLREIAAERFRRNNGMPLPVDQVALTSGSMQAISLISLMIDRQGGRVLADEFSYAGTLKCFRKFGLEVHPVEMDEQGMHPESLNSRLNALPDSDRPTFIYTTATNQNPTGATSNAERREAILDAARSHGAWILDDDCYADLIFEGQAPLSYRAMAPESVIYLGSFSKLLGPGLRVGYLSAPEELLEQILHWKIDGGTSALTSMVAAEFLRTELWTHLQVVNEVSRQKLSVLVDALDARPRSFPGYIRPSGGLFLWASLPPAVDPAALRLLARARGVHYAEGRRYDVLDREVPLLRIAFGFASADELRCGIPVLADCIESLLDHESLPRQEP